MKQRDAARSKDLVPRRLQALQDAGVLGQPKTQALTPARDAAWDEHYALLQAYKTEHGHADVHTSYVTTDGVHLGLWLRAQRRAQQAGALPRERERRLSMLGVTWRL